MLCNFLLLSQVPLHNISTFLLKDSLRILELRTSSFPFLNNSLHFYLLFISLSKISNQSYFSHSMYQRIFLTSPKYLISHLNMPENCVDLCSSNSQHLSLLWTLVFFVLWINHENSHLKMTRSRLLICKFIDISFIFLWDLRFIFCSVQSIIIFVFFENLWLRFHHLQFLLNLRVKFHFII